MSQFKEHGLPELRGPNNARHNHLETIQRVRIEETATTREFMGPMLSIPPLDWAVLKVKFPELISRDPQIQKQAFDTFMAHPASEPYRTRERKRINGASL
jgi:hypothetical protein